MCGIFGLVRHEGAAHPERATAVFVELGRLSVERGKDAAGFAVANRPDVKSPLVSVARVEADARRVTVGHVTVVKDTVSFDELWDDGEHLGLVHGHRVVLGHTRWATQGKRDQLTNTSPMMVESVVGTHNGDVDVRSVPGHHQFGPLFGSTDTEVLYRALSFNRGDRRKMTDVLRRVEGRAALAWLDRGRVDRVYLARAALSPLTVAWDREGNFYWASNPRWFRDIDVKFHGMLGFHDITIVQEGTLLTVSLDETAPVVVDRRSFTPSCRVSDARLSDLVVWRGFEAMDVASDKGQLVHKVAPVRVPVAKAGRGVAATGSYRRSAGRGVVSYPGFGWNVNESGFKATTVNQSKKKESRDPWTGVPPWNTDVVDGDVASIVDSLWDTSTVVDPFDAEEASFGFDSGFAYEEARESARRWFDNGADPAEFNVIMGASMPSEIDALMFEYDLSTVEAFHEFKSLVARFS